jgi:hypothetical protein
MRAWVGLWMSVGLCLACQQASSNPEEYRPPEPPAPLPEPGGSQPGGSESGPETSPPAPSPETWRQASFYAGVSPEGLAIGDFNEDGAPDVMVNARGRNYQGRTAPRMGEFPLLLNDGSGHLTLAGAPVRWTSSGRLVAGDVDGDGHLDALVGTHDGVRLLRGQGDGTLSDVSGTPPGGVVASLGLWSTGPGPAAIWSVSNHDSRYIWGGMAGFALMRPTGTGTWSTAALSVDDQVLVRMNDSGWAPVVADFNEDGLPDVAVNLADGPWKAHVFLGTAWGATRPAGPLPTQAAALRRVSAADFNQDGHVDLLALGRASLEVFLGDGQGGFTRTEGRSLTTVADDAAVVDFDGDGRQDVVALHAATSEVSLLRGQGDGTLVPHGRWTVGRRPSAAAAADLDRDGRMDLLIAEADDNTVSVYHVPSVPESRLTARPACPLGAEDGVAPVEETPEPLMRLDVGGEATSAVAVGDFDGDGHPDLALTRKAGIRLVLHADHDTFSFREVPDSSGMSALAAGDLDGDGRAELAAGVLGMQYLLWNDAQGGFSERQEWETGHDPLFADFNGDGRLDLTLTLSGHCSGPVLRMTNLGQRQFQTEFLEDYNIEGDGQCQGVSGAVAGDFNGDGTLDLLHTTMGINLNPTARDGGVLPGHGFELDTRFGPETWSVDADGDGRMDVVVRGDATKAELRLFRGDGHGSLQAPFTCALPSAGRLLTWEDVNGDGVADVVGEDADGQGLWVGVGTGRGRWRPRHYALGGAVQWARAVNLVGDARPELVVLMRSGELRVFPAPRP